VYWCICGVLVCFGPRPTLYWQEVAMIVVKHFPSPTPLGSGKIALTPGLQGLCC
jgi:hypothetical protein